ncbi:MAG TPA: hypothetical protein VNM15_04930 [Candidatus Binatia bacterium]|nr:hypothetical protein [Candidatus Binatia bacterium]
MDRYEIRRALRAQDEKDRVEETVFVAVAILDDGTEREGIGWTAEQAKADIEGRGYEWDYVARVKREDDMYPAARAEAFARWGGVVCGDGEGPILSREPV